MPRRGQFSYRLIPGAEAREAEVMATRAHSSIAEARRGCAWERGARMPRSEGQGEGEEGLSSRRMMRWGSEIRWSKIWKRISLGRSMRDGGDLAGIAPAFRLE